ncbi:V-set and immunoglobulin domain-containing protein 10-like [Carcharodon carcharias]|uniref:V-set and immunoglobulin domain-containing protein 10-like n=1 Tax=Carcharodon carcharias TaxID=13397 RepID=UPI001B7E7F9E|nr:V-set and immunoglobulin domain-containing protein 10-like [Carcharodon carcharias]
MHTGIGLLWAGLLSGLAECIEIQANSPVRAVVGDITSLEVVYKSIHPPHVDWARGKTFASWKVGQSTSLDVSLAFKGRLRVNTSSASIELLNTTLSDNGTYVVSLTAVDEEPSSRTVTLRVYELIKGVKVVTPVGDVKEGEPKVTMTCTMATGTWDTLIWTKDGKQIVSDAHTVIAGDELTIKDVIRGDSGTYTCSVQNPFSNDASHKLLRIYYGPDVPTVSIVSSLDPEPSRFVLVNSTVNLTCATSSEPPAQHFWSVGESGDTSVPSDPTLTLERVQLDQAGVYSCIVVNTKMGRSVRKTLTLNVYELPWGEPSCSMVSVENHRTLQFSCAWRGGYPRARIHWLGLSRNISADSQLVLNENSPARLSGENVTCVALHSAAVKYCTLRPMAPWVTLSRWTVRETQSDVTVTLKCEVGSNPAAVIHWFKGQKELVSEGKLIISLNRSEIQIQDFSVRNDTGNYSCSCRNPLGESRPSLMLTAPQVSGLTVRRLNGTAASIAWSTRDSDVVTSFLVQSQSNTQRVSSSSSSSSSSSWVTLKEAGMAERTATITQLREEQGYFFRVLPLTGTQPGEASPAQSIAPTVDNRLSGGAIAGIVLGCVVGALLIILLIVFLIRHRYKNKKAVTGRQRASEKNNDYWDHTSALHPNSAYINRAYSLSNQRTLERTSQENTSGKSGFTGTVPL